MIIYLSGQDGVKREIPETVLEGANIMLSFNTAVIKQAQDTKPNGRLQRLLRYRAKARKKNGSDTKRQSKRRVRL